MEFFSFDAAYLERLASGDPETERHFSDYFSELILIKLRSRQYSRSTIEDVRQETFLRVFRALKKDGIREPERIGAFVISVCNHVVQEFGRAGSRLTYTDQNAPDFPDDRSDAEHELMDREQAADVRVVLAGMSPKNRQLLSAVFLEERSTEEVCKQFKVDSNYLRVLLFRARAQFRQAMNKRKPR